MNNINPEFVRELLSHKGYIIINNNYTFNIVEPRPIPTILDNYNILCKYYDSNLIKPIFIETITNNLAEFINYKYELGNNIFITNTEFSEVIIKNIRKLSVNALKTLLNVSDSTICSIDTHHILQNIHINIMTISNPFANYIIHNYGISHIINKIDCIDTLSSVIKHNNNNLVYKLFIYYVNNNAGEVNREYINYIMNYVIDSVLNLNYGKSFANILLCDTILLMSSCDSGAPQLIDIFTTINKTPTICRYIRKKNKLYNNYIDLFYYLHRYSSFINMVDTDKDLVTLYNVYRPTCPNNLIYNMLTRNKAGILGCIDGIIKFNLDCVDLRICDRTSIELSKELLYKCSYDIISTVYNCMNKYDDLSFTNMATLYNLEYLISNKACKLCLTETTNLHIPNIVKNCCEFVYCLSCKDKLNSVCINCNKSIA